MNEFGEIGIDSKIVEGKHTRIIELAGGCVCCELTGEFVAAVNELIDRYQPDLIVLEATGVAEADALVYEVEEELARARLDSVICIVDGHTSIRYPQVGYVGRVQLQQADIVLINKRDLITLEELATVTAQIRRFNETAAVMATERCAGVEELWVALANRPAGARPHRPPPVARTRQKRSCSPFPIRPQATWIRQLSNGGPTVCGSRCIEPRAWWCWTGPAISSTPSLAGGSWKSFRSRPVSWFLSANGSWTNGNGSSRNCNSVSGNGTYLL